MRYTYLIIALLIGVFAVSSCSKSSGGECQYLIEAEFITLTETEPHPYAGIYKDVNSDNTFIVIFDSRKQMNEHSEDGVLCLSMNQGFYFID